LSEILTGGASGYVESLDITDSLQTIYNVGLLEASYGTSREIGGTSITFLVVIAIAFGCDRNILIA
jgi:hypothetical protein